MNKYKPKQESDKYPNIYMKLWGEFQIYSLPENGNGYKRWEDLPKNLQNGLMAMCDKAINNGKQIQMKKVRKIYKG